MTLLPSRWCAQCMEYHPDHQHIPRWLVKPLVANLGEPRAVYAHTAGQAAERWAETEDREQPLYTTRLSEGRRVEVIVMNMGTGYMRRYEVSGETVPRYLAKATSEIVTGSPAERVL